MRFVDEADISVSSGHGGKGAVSFRREAMVPRGGPDGGDGGRGGHVIFKTNKDLNTLLEFRYRRIWNAPDGQPGQGSNCSGSSGADLKIEVPEGTLVIDKDSNEVLLDMQANMEIALLEGGRGGKGNAFFKTSVNQAPTHSQPGEPGVAKQIHLELKLIAQVGIVGFPNVGKSTFISRISAAKPKIADYPFTTLVPNLGVVKYNDEKSFVVADIPGLVAGAHTGTGLGTQFLRHIERTKVFIHIVDVGPFSGQDPVESYDAIRAELVAHDELNHEKEGFIPLATRPEILVLNKIDTVDAETLKSIVDKFADKKLKVFCISGVTGQGIKELLNEVVKYVFT